MNEKKIAKIEVIGAGSNPDIDSDFRTDVRDLALEHVSELYGKENVASIITFNSLAAKSAFKTMCTIYNKPFAAANKIASLVPEPIEGDDCTLNDIFDTDSDRYSEGAEFRSATSGSDWEDIVEGARHIEGRIKSTGVHPCFTKDTLITTINDLTPIDQITVGTKVLTHNKKYYEVVEKIENKSEDIYLLETINSIPTKVTGNHPFYVRTIDSNNKLTPPKWKNLKDLNIGTDFIGTPINNNNEIPENENIPFLEKEEFWRILGAYVRSGKYDNSETVNKKITIMTKTDNLLYFGLTDDIIELFTYQIEQGIEQDEKKVEINIDVDNETFNFIKLFGNGKVNKNIPDFVINLPNNLLKAFTQGYLSIDKNNFDYRLHKFTAVNKKVALRMIQALNKVYRIPCVSKLSKNNTVSTGPVDVESYSISFDLDFNDKNFLYDDGYLWVRIENISKLDIFEKTYNLSVIDDNSYVANNLIAHNCGVIISSKPLSDVIPLKIREDDGRTITQWTYQECENLGLIKFDFLGLDTVDLIQHTVDYINKNGKTAPNMIDLIHGDMDDKKTYEMFSRGHTIGIFQFGSPMVQDFCKLMKPDTFEDICATTALLRPGPMGMQSHVRYAFRKNGREEVKLVHQDFKDSPLETILSKTQGLVTYQEQIIKIANEIAGMTLQEGDVLRKAMGKKNMSVMLEMRPKFFEGALKNGYSQEAILILWNTIAEFAKYGFNRSHSVAYAMNAYQSAYLKTHYPVEFMAALIAQNVDNKDKILTFLQEARRMKLKVGTVDINKSDVRVAPNYSKEGDIDIVYGLSGINAVSESVAKIIVDEREANGPYKSIQDLINRCSPIGVSNKRIYENLALAGAFDGFGISRKAAVENLSSMMGEAKTKTALGTSLFDLFDDVEDYTVDLESIPEYPFVEKLQKEANVIGLYLTDHPLSRAGKGFGVGKVHKINKVLQNTSSVNVNIVGSITELQSKTMRRGGKSVRITVDDGTGYIEANLKRDLVKGLGKYEAQERLKRLYVSGETSISDEVAIPACDKEFTALEPIEKNAVYIMNITFRPPIGDAPYGARVNSITPVALSDEGLLPVRIRINSKTKTRHKEYVERAMKFSELLSKKFPGEYPIFVSIFNNDDMLKDNDPDTYYRMLVEQIRNDSAPKIKTARKQELNSKDNLFTDSSKKKTDKSDINNDNYTRELPEMIRNKDDSSILTESELAKKLEYFDTGFKTDKISRVEELLSSKFGAERIDFGIFDTSMDDED